MILKTRSAGTRIALCVILIPGILMCTLFGLLYSQKDTHSTPHPNNIYDETWVVVVDKDYEPYSFYNEKGEPIGFDVEMIYAVADAAHKNVELRMTSWNEAIAAVSSGEADLLLGLEYTPKDLPQLTLSMPLHNDPFVVFSKGNFSNISQLYKKKIAVLENSGSYPLVITPYLLNNEAIAYSSYSDVFQALEDGRTDYAIARYSVGRRAVARMENSKIEASGPALASNDFCMGTGVGNDQLIEEVNEAILLCRSDGTLDRLSEKWLGRYVEIISLSDFFIRYKDIIFTVFALLLLVVTFGFIYSYRRRLSISRDRELDLLERAARDGMTQLYNKHATEDLIEQIIIDSMPESRHAFIMMDIDNFKKVNDTFGHNFGDMAIFEFTAGMKSVFAPPDILSRVGGDEFAVFMKDISGEKAVLQRMDKLIPALRRSVASGSDSCTLSGSAGIAFYPEDGTNFADLYKHADEALYRAKEQGKGCYTVYTGEREQQKAEGTLPD